jgi:hypothetical protein
MPRHRSEDRRFELGAKGILAIIVLVSLGAGGLQHFTQVFTGIIELLIAVAVVLILGWLGITLGVRASKNQPAIDVAAPLPYLASGTKEPASQWIWPDGKGTTLRSPETKPKIASLSVNEPMTAQSEKPELWTEAKILEQIRKLDWYQFEKFNVLLLKAEGWHATQVRGEHGDGGKDIVAGKNGHVLYVQCKALSSPVREKIVRELLGSLAIADGPSGAIHAAGPFSKSAQQLAAAVGIPLYDDHALAVRAQKSIPAAALPGILSELPHLCPKCDSEMASRTGAFGPFLGCARYPRCRGKFSLQQISR